MRQTLLWIRRVHQWLGLLLAIQLLFWVGGGFVMSLLDIDKVHGDHLRTDVAPSVFTTEFAVSLNEVLASNQLSPTRVEFIRVSNLPVYKIYEGSLSYYSALTGAPLAPLSDDQIKTLAAQRYNGDGELAHAVLISEVPPEARPVKAPVWQVTFSDAVHTTFYLQPISGELLRVRSDLWRAFDFVWMLHIMDYETRDDFNHPLLIAFAGTSLIFVLSGFGLLYHRFVRPKLRR